MPNPSSLKEYEISIGGFGGIGIDSGHYTWPGPGAHQPNVISVEGFSFTNHAVGGCGRATINLVAENSEYLRNRLSLESGTYTYPDSPVLIQLRCDDEPNLIHRYIGLISRMGMAGGTDPHRATIECRGSSSYLRKIPLFIATDNLSVKANAELVFQFISGRHYTAYETDLVIAGNGYDIRQVDFLDTPADRALELLAKVAGPNVLWGFCPGVWPGYAPRPYFLPRDDSIGPTFMVGDNVTMAKWSLNKDRSINGVLVRCQRKLGGGDLTLWVPPGTVTGQGIGTTPWRIEKLRINETIDPADAWEYANAYLEEHAPMVKDVKFSVGNYGRQIWPDEIINTKARIYLTKDPVTGEPGGDGHFEDVWVESSTVQVKGDGSITTTLRLGEDRDTQIADFLGDMFHEVQAGDISEFWTAAELAAADNNTVREWRHHAAANHAARNFWHAPVTGLESVIDKEQAGILGLRIPYFEHHADWEWDDKTNGIIMPGDTGVVYSCFIPTGRPAITAAVYAEVGERWYKGSTSNGLWDGRSTGNGFESWSTSGSLRPMPSIYSDPYVAEAHLLQELDPAVDHSPIIIDIDRPHHSGAHITTAPTTFTELVAMPNFTDVFSAMQLHGSSDPFNPLTRYYGCRLVGITDGGYGVHVYAGLGWGFNELGFTNSFLIFHNNHFDGTRPPMDSFYVSSDKNSGSYCAFLRMVFTLPSEQNSYQNYGVAIYKEDTGTLLAEMTGTVVPFGSTKYDLWHPGAIYSGTWDQRRPYAAGMWWEDYPDQQPPSNYIRRPSPHGIRQVKLSSSALSDLRVGATTDGTSWGHGLVGERFWAGGGDPWVGGENDGKHGMHLAIELPPNVTMKRLGVTFKHEGEINP